MVVLNQRFRNRRIKDFVMEQCKSWSASIIPRTTALAMVSMQNEMLERRLAGIEDKVLRDLTAADSTLQQLEDMQSEYSDQTVLNPTL